MIKRKRIGLFKYVSSYADNPSDKMKESLCYWSICIKFYLSGCCTVLSSCQPRVFLNIGKTVSRSFSEAKVKELCHSQGNSDKHNLPVQIYSGSFTFVHSIVLFHYELITRDN